jgi:abortive phage resistance protein AbiGi (putative antitoxin)
MVCFCDLKLSLTEKHQEKYGSVAIGLKKSWAIKNKLNPVSYQLKESSYTSAIEDLSQLLQALTDEEHKDGLPEAILINQIRDQKIKHLLHKFLLIIHSFKKSYVSESNGVDGEVIVYYDEREWRYIPIMIPDDYKSYEKLRKEDRNHFVIDENTYFNELSKKRYQNEIIKNHSLKFDENDIDIVIAESDKHKMELQTELKNAYGCSFIENNIKTYLEITNKLSL